MIFRRLEVHNLYLNFRCDQSIDLKVVTGHTICSRRHYILNRRIKISQASSRRQDRPAKEISAQKTNSVDLKIRATASKME